MSTSATTKKKTEEKAADNLYYQQADKALAEAGAQLARQAEEQKAAVNAQIDTKLATAQRTTDEKIASTEQDYRDLVDTTAVQRELNRRRVAESVANLGLSRSGLNASQLTAVELSAGNALSAADRQRQAAVDSLRRSLLDYQKEAEETRRQSLSNIDSAMTGTLSEYKNDLYAAAAEATSADRQAAIKQETALAKLAAEAKTEQQKTTAAALKTLYTDGCISPAVYASALERGTTVGQLAGADLIRQAGTYSAKTAKKTTTQTASTGSSLAGQYATANKTLLSNGAIDQNTYAAAITGGLSPTEALRYQEQSTAAAADNTATNTDTTLAWSWSNAAYRKTGIDTANGVLGLGTWFGTVDTNDTVEYYDQRGVRRTVTLGELQKNLIADGMSASDAKAFVKRFNKRNGDNTTYFLDTGGRRSYTDTVRSFVEAGFAAAGTAGVASELEAAYAHGLIDEQVYQKLGQQYGVTDNDILALRQNKGTDSRYLDASKRYKDWGL